MSNIRKIALELLLTQEAAESYVNLLLASQKASSLSKEERASLTALLYTTVEKKITYDYIIATLAARPVEKISPTVLNALRIGLCQIFDMRSIPDFAAVNETVSLVKGKGERSFVNAVLRAAVRVKDNPPRPDRGRNLARHLSVRYSVPMPLVKHYVSIFGNDGAEKLLEEFSKTPPLSLSVNTKITDRDALIAKLSSLGAKASEYTDFGVIIPKSISPTAIDGFSEGEFFVQDEAGRIAISALDIGNCDTVIDVCAAPGGKSFAAAIKASEGEVYSFDIHESKLSLIESGKARLGLENITVAQRDATEFDERLFGKADKVICDVPCSGLGVIWKKPDLKYKSLDILNELPELQYSILEESVKYLKVGGEILYSTCTLNPSENEKVTDRFINENKEFSYVERTVGSLTVGEGGLTLAPHIHGTDGFFIAVMRKNK